MDDVYKAAVSGQAALLFNHGMIILLMDLSITLRRNIYMIYAIIYSKKIYIYCYNQQVTRSEIANCDVL